MNLTGRGAEPDQWAPIDIDLRFDGMGNSPRTMFGGSNGRLIVVLGTAPIDNNIIDRLATDVLAEVMETLNPFRKDERRTNLQCAVFGARLEDGVARIEPLAAQTDKVTLVGQGRIDFSTEALDLAWVAKPRKGVGLSASTITNPYIKLGGTLASPSVEIKPAQAVASTGAAIATAGLSILARGLWDRVTAEKKVCEQAIEKVAETAGR
jgi:hypothetical protein